MTRSAAPHERRLLFLSALMLAGLLSLAVTHPAAAPDELDALLARMQKAEDGLRTVSFDFTETADIAVTGDKQVIKGSATFAKPNRFRLEHQLPQKQTVVSDGKTLWFYNPGRNQVLMDDWQNWAESAGFPKGLLPFELEVTDLRKKYAVTLESRVEAPRKATVLKLVPLQGGPWPYTFRVWIADDNSLPFRTEMETQSVKAVTEITRLEANPKLSDRFFKFEIPEGVEALRAPGVGKKP